VVGSRGYGPVGRLVHGSTSQRLARAAHCPLLVLTRAVGAGSDADGLRQDAVTAHVAQPADAPPGPDSLYGARVHEGHPVHLHGGWRAAQTALIRQWRQPADHNSEAPAPVNRHELITDALNRATFQDLVEVTDDETVTRDEEIAS
jgi:hypothetical protein